MKSKFFSTRSGRFISAVVIIVVAVVAAHWYVSDTPRERNRVRHRAGYSVIHPEGWSPDMRHGSGDGAPGIPPTRDLIYLSPDHYLGPEPSLYVKRLVGAVDPTVLKKEGWTDGTFQGQPALLYWQQLKHSFVRAAFFERNGQWFEVEQTLPDAAKLDNDEWWAFLETFKYPDGPIDPDVDRPIHPTTAAATAEATTQAIQF